jgi:glycosyltransferase involved in cell wall biosynthesis
MKIGLDMSVIQTPHRMRGIGATAINFVSNLSDEAKQQHAFVLYMYEEDRQEALDILDLRGVNYEVRTLRQMKPFQAVLPRRLHLLGSGLNYLRSLYVSRRGDLRQADLSGLDVYLQFDQMQSPPKRAGLKTATVLYDLIPYVMEADYMWSYDRARHNGLSKKSALRKALTRKRYLAQAAMVARNVDQRFAISEHTKQDYMRYVGLEANDIEVVHLGVSRAHQPKSEENVSFSRYEETSWGYFARKFDLNDKPFLLFIGGADPRRRLFDLIGAYNMLRAQGVEIRLVLAGDTMNRPEAIPVPHGRQNGAISSYEDDMAFLGFVSNKQRDWLYSHALAMVYPSVYEGFGLPVLEAMQYATPVITYDNTSIREVAGDAALYATDAASIKDRVTELLDDPKLQTEYGRKGQERAAEFSWAQTTEEMLKRLLG